jgi:hypothetical protein
MALRIARHLGVSFVPGLDLVHLWLDPADPAASSILERWERRIVQLRLGQTLAAGSEPGHHFAPAYVFLGASHVTDALTLPDTAEGEAEAQALLLPLAMDRGTIDKSYALYRELARERGWVATPAMLGRYASTLIGVGRHARWISLNLGEHTSAPIAFAGTHKGYGREFLKSHGFPVAAGGHAATPEAAVRRARAAGFPVVLKGLMSGNSEAVILGVEDEDGCREGAAALMGPEGAPILVEAMVQGVEVRAHFAAGKLHSVYRAVPRYIEGDGKTSLLRLMKQTMPDFLRMSFSHPVLSRRLVFQLWRFGVRKIEDLARLIVDAGEKVRVSAATFAGMEQLERTAIHPDDRARIESVLERYGAPSCGVDLILAGLGRPLADGGIVIELNCPCGFGYVSNPREVATLELDALVTRASGFVAAEGRVPVWLVTKNDFANGERRSAIVEAAGRDGRAVGVHRADPERGWLPILGDPKDQLVVEIDETCAIAMGMPANLRPQVVAEAPESIANSHPRLWATALEAAGSALILPTRR